MTNRDENTTPSTSPFASVFAAASKIQAAGAPRLLSRGFLWLQGRRQASNRARRLEICATVSLGEKRFVSILECDGQQFLIGGGASEVRLLARLSAIDIPGSISTSMTSEVSL